MNERRIALSEQRTLVLRALEMGDVDGLVALYDGLDSDARYRRFFSMYRPRRKFFEHLAAVADRGGAGLVAEVVEPGSATRLVAEASFELLPNRNAELAMTVAAAWRGWLGPYLLDALCEVAAAHGVPNLESDVLLSNGPMLALLRSRGQVVVPHDDWTTLRVIISTAGWVPSWPDEGAGLRVLIEGTDSEWRSRSDDATADLLVLACPGPKDRRHPCPALTGAACPLAAGADVIVVTDQSGTEQWDALRSAHADLHPDVPVCIRLHDGASSSDVFRFVERLARAHAGRTDGG